MFRGKMLYLFLKYPIKYLLQEFCVMIQCFLNEILWNKNVYKYKHSLFTVSLIYHMFRFYRHVILTLQIIQLL